MNIVEPIFAQCRNKPSELALCAPGTEFDLVSYARLQRSVNNICRRIIAAGIAPRSRTGVAIQDPILHAMIVIALTRLGMVTTSATARDAPWPIALDAIIADRSVQSTANLLLADSAWTEGDDRPLAEEHLYHAAPNEFCRIVLTSAANGRPTAIALTHGMIATRLDRQKLFFGPRAPFCDRTHLDMPLATALGFQVILGTLWRGGALLMTWDPQKTLAALGAYRIRNMVTTAQSLIKLAEAVNGRPAYRSELVAVFSANDLAAEESERVRAYLCPNVTVGYIAGDRTMVASMPAQMASKVRDAVGYVLPGIVVEVVDDQDRSLPPAQDGNLRIRSDYGAKEYLDDPEATRIDFRNGWFYPGARGRLTRTNMLAITKPSKSQQQPIWRAAVMSS